MDFSFTTVGRILFGCGVSSRIAEITTEYGEHPLVITGKDANRAKWLISILDSAELDYTIFSVPGEPDIELIDRITILARGSKCDVVIGVGGGSVIDAGKAASALIPNTGNPLDYLEVIGRGEKLTEAPLPYIALPTTSGTGSEVTKNAVLKSRQHRVKISLRSPLMFPTVAIVDPELTLSLPSDVTAWTGMDALEQNIEPFVSLKSNPLSEAIAHRGLKEAALHLYPAYTDGDSLQHRVGMSVASLHGGLALANSGLGAVHGCAGVIGGMFDAPHGAVCGCLLPYVMEENIRYLEARDASNSVLGRYEEISRILTGDLNVSPLDGVQWVNELTRKLTIPGLASFGVSSSDIDEIVSKSRESSSMKGNPVKLPDSTLVSILEKAL